MFRGYDAKGKNKILWPRPLRRKIRKSRLNPAATKGRALIFGTAHYPALLRFMASLTFSASSILSMD